MKLPRDDLRDWLVIGGACAGTAILLWATLLLEHA